MNIINNNYVKLKRLFRNSCKTNSYYLIEFPLQKDQYTITLRQFQNDHIQLQYGHYKNVELLK